MTQEQLDSVLLPNAKLVSFIIDPEKMKEVIRKTHERQEAVLNQKIITREVLEQIITI
jgi:hypothetical protein